MGQLLHGSAKTTHAVRAAIQRSKATIAELDEKYDLNPKTVMKWRRRQSVEDMPMGPQNARSTVLSPEEEAASGCLPQAHAPAARRLPLCVAGNHSASDAIVATPPLPAPRHLAPAERRRREDQEEVQNLSDRLLPY